MAPMKLHGRAFYESIGSPKYVVAPMVDQSEFAWRLLTRSFLAPELRSTVLAYSPMLHAKLFSQGPKYRASHFEPLKPPLSIPQPGDVQQQKLFGEQEAFLDGNRKFDRPLFVQFCANEPAKLLEAAKLVQPFCDAVDLNLGCPQGIAKRGHYGAFLQEDWDTIYNLINTLHKELDIPVTAKMRILETREKTLEYAKMILSAGASLIAVHGRQREQKGHNTGLADWKVIRYLREQLPPDTVIFANGNILQHSDLQECLEATKADAVMSAEGNLYDPSIFAPGPPAGEEGREYWRGKNGKGGYRADAVLRRYLDIIHEHILQQSPPQRRPLFVVADLHAEADSRHAQSVPNKVADDTDDDGPPAAKRQKRDDARKGKGDKCINPNLVALQPHCFHILRSIVGVHHNVRDALAKSRPNDIDAYENVLTLTEQAVKEGLLDYEKNPSKYEDIDSQDGGQAVDPELSSTAAVQRCKRPYWVCQPLVRPLPKEAFEKGSMQLSKKEKAKQRAQQEERDKAGVSASNSIGVVQVAETNKTNDDQASSSTEVIELPTKV